MNSQESEREEKMRQEWIAYRNSVSENKSKSQDDFEKYINLLAAGGIVLSLTFLEKIISLDKTICRILVVVGMTLMIVTLLSNLYSHYRSMVDSDLTIKDIDDENYENLFKNIDKRNQKINLLNIVSIWSVVIGIACLISFASINICLMNTNGSKPQHPKPLTEEKQRGRTTPPPPQSKPNNYPKK